MRIPGIGRIKPYRQQLAEWVSAHGMILLYHRVTHLAADPQKLAVSPENFAQQLETMNRIGRPVPLTDLPDHLRSAKHGEPPFFCVTFDDGYLDNLIEAVPLLEEYNVPATVFVTTGTVGHSHELWWDDIERIFLTAPDLPDHLELTIGHHAYTWTFPAEPPLPDQHPWTILDHASTPRRKAYQEITALIRNLPPDQRDGTIQHLREWAQVARPPRDDHRTLTPEELRKLDASPLITIGAHTVNHPVLSEIPFRQQVEEISRSKEHLEQILGHTVETFAYPYGRIEDYNRHSIHAVHQCRFTLACANFPALATRWTPRYEFPRFVVGNWTAKEFETQLSTN